MGVIDPGSQGEIATTTSSASDLSVSDILAFFGNTFGRVAKPLRLLGLLASAYSATSAITQTQDVEGIPTSYLQNSEQIAQVVSSDIEIVKQKSAEDIASVVAVTSTTSSTLDEQKTLLGVLESNAKSLNDLLAVGFAGLLNQLGLISQASLSSSANVVSSVALLNENVSKIATSLDAQLILSSEIYGQLDRITVALGGLSSLPSVLETVVTELKALSEAVSSLELNFSASSVNLDLSEVTARLDSLISLMEMTKERDIAFIDHLAFLKNSMAVKDLDGNVVVEAAPRELEAIKNASVAREKTDINNFELDSADFDIAALDFDLLELTKFSQILSEAN